MLKPSERISEIEKSMRVKMGLELPDELNMIRSSAIILFLDEQYTKQEGDWRSIPCEKHKFERSCECGKPSESSTPIVEECKKCDDYHYNKAMSAFPENFGFCECKCHTSNKKI